MNSRQTFAEHKGSCPHHQAHASAQGYCLPEERYQQEGMRTLPPLQWWSWSMLAGTVLHAANDGGI